MQELSSSKIDAVVGGNLLTGWVPNNWPGITVSPDFLVSLGVTGVRIPGPFSPSVSATVPRLQGVASFGYFSPGGNWDC